MTLKGTKKKRRPSDSSPVNYRGWSDLALQTSFTFAGVVLIGVFGGRWLDTHFGTTPLFILIGTLWGIVAGLYWLIMKVREFGERQEDKEGKKSD